ncbi:MAG TPA: DegT/DnrJ/EryC1/StrS family aminotransferase [Gemmatimonadaceae bacterium]|nr:DegT/DnrJ/EryC1/StrS family aminotransferase [Gemmatimonadaceae bacterium]
MDTPFIPQMEPWFGEEEKRALCEYMDEGGFITEFKRTQQFERMVGEFTGARHCVVVNNGTISLTIAAMSLGVGAGDEVIVPNYTMIATPNSVKMFGAVPVFVDVERETLCMDIELARGAVTAKTKAIMLVSANGRYPGAGITAFEKFAAERGIALIEDAAQSLGSRYPDGRHIGRAGIVGSFSFSAPKIISTGQGGALITDDDVVAFKLRRLKDFGRSAGGTDIHESIGYNFKFTELQACVGIEQMRKLQGRVQRKKALWTMYRDRLRSIPTVALFAHDLENTTPWFVDALVERREQLQDFLKERGIGTRVMYSPINRQAAYRLPGRFPVCELVGQKGLWLPSSNQLTENQVERICDAIGQFYA